MGKYLFIFAFFSLVPILVFAANTESYGFIVGGGPDCGINTIPKFIKATLDLAVKVGIPVASIFLIFAGFQFLTAQGDEGKLRKAKSGFFWTSIGFGVLLGAWLFATAVLGTITSIMGGSAKDAVITPCDEGGNSTESKPVYAALSCPSRIGGEYSAGSNPAFVSLNLENNPLRGIYPESNKCSFGSAMEFLVEQATSESNENSYIFMKDAFIGGKSVDVTLTVNEGKAAGAVLPDPVDVKKLLIKYKPTSLYIIHTHPLDTVGTEGVMARPSDMDIIAASTYSLSVNDTRVKNMVADSTGLWAYGGANYTKWATEVENFSTNFNKSGKPTEIEGKDACGRGDIIERALFGQYGKESKAWAQELMNGSGNYLHAVEYDVNGVTGTEAGTGRTLTIAERNNYMKKSTTILNGVGVSMSYTPYSGLSCIQGR